MIRKNLMPSSRTEGNRAILGKMVGTGFHEGLMCEQLFPGSMKPLS